MARGKFKRCERGLGADDLLDARAQGGPMFSRHIEMAPEIEPRHLANALSVALTAHQAIGDIGFPIPFIARGSATNEHGRTLHTRPIPGKRGTQLLWH